MYWSSRRLAAMGAMLSRQQPPRGGAGSSGETCSTLFALSNEPDPLGADLLDL